MFKDLLLNVFKSKSSTTIAIDRIEDSFHTISYALDIIREEYPDACLILSSNKILLCKHYSPVGYHIDPSEVMLRLPIENIKK